MCSNRKKEMLHTMRIRLYVLLLLGVVTMTATSMLQAQARPEMDLAVTFSAQRSGVIGGNSFWAQGGSAELSATVSHGFGVAMNIAGLRASNISSSGVNLTMVTTTFGPRYTWSHLLHPGAEKQIKLFGQALVGEAHGLDSVFPDSSGAQASASALALQVGGGVDLALTRHFALRPIQADWIRTQFPSSSTNVQNNFRLGTGFVLRLR